MCKLLMVVGVMDVGDVDMGIEIGVRWKIARLGFSIEEFQKIDNLLDTPIFKILLIYPKRSHNIKTRYCGGYEQIIDDLHCITL